MNPINEFQTDISAILLVRTIREIIRIIGIVVLFVPIEDVVCIYKHRKPVAEEIGTKAEIDAIGGLVRGKKGLGG